MSKISGFKHSAQLKQLSGSSSTTGLVECFFELGNLSGRDQDQVHLKKKNETKNYMETSVYYFISVILVFQSEIHIFTTKAFTYMVSLFLRGPPYGMKGRLPVAA